MDGRNIISVLFDLDGTLRHNRPSSTETFLNVAVELGVQDSPERRRRAIRWTHCYWANSEDLQQDLSLFQGEDELFWQNYAMRMLSVMGCPPELARSLAPELHRYMRDEHKPIDWVPPDVPETLGYLKGCGYRLGLLSNRDDPIHEYLAQLGIGEYFDLALVGGEVNSYKPDPGIFHHALRRLDSLPEQAIYVGDNYYADVIGALRAGVQPVLLDPDGLFPEANCPIIRAVGEIKNILI